MRASLRPAWQARSHRPVRATCSSSGPSGTRPPRRGTHGTPVSSSLRSWSTRLCSNFAGVLDVAQLGRQLVQQGAPYLRPVRMVNGREGCLLTREQPPASGLVASSWRTDLAAEAAHRRRVDQGEPERQGPGDIAQLTPRERRGEQHVHVAAAGWRDVGDHLAAAAAHEVGDRRGLAGHLGAGISVVGVVAGAGHVEVKGEHPAGSRARVVHRHRARLARRGGRAAAGVAGRVGAAAVAGDPDVRQYPPARASWHARQPLRRALARHARGRRCWPGRLD